MASAFWVKSECDMVEYRQIIWPQRREPELIVNLEADWSERSVPSVWRMLCA